ncbi:MULTISPECIES: ABC transporter substrate-binding protein [Comamonas]|jgi:ABC-type branched-subunit amino acid transport system substrate-binding protein|uniref:ABC transporter substrate-binding protein n=1 Tax=Comamonas TaxID=283 RepID=UPI0012C96FF3|nr:MULTISPECIES: ABC transporter substrate-binding protein [Comamonas]MDR3064502.1 ABC transporter substrate-binding protein [Comamonas sp.]MEB5964114.1 ABC transporter substrate-binding protein [Comamonas testosteroni]MPS95551.1 ABC transporter substrate-binding protein [Comamonas sp.]
MNRKHWVLARAGLAALCAGGALVAQAWTVGQVAPMSGAEASQGRAYAQGMRLYFDQVNKAGGVQGQPVELAALDDLGHPEETVAKTRKLLSESKPVVLAGYFGNRNLSALLESKSLDGSQIPLVGYQSTDTRVLASPLMFSTRAGLVEQVAKISTHLATVGITRLALVFEERPDAQELTALVTKAVNPSGAKLVTSAMVKSRSGSDKAVQELQASKASPQAILLVASSPATAAFVEAYRMEGGTAQIYATAEADIEQLAKRLPVEYMSGLSIAQVVPSPYKVSGKLNKEFRDATIAAGKSLDVPVSFAMMEGYVNAKVIVEAMRRSQPVTPEKMSAALRGLESFDLGGYWVNFKPGQVGSKYVDLSIVNAAGRVTQ